MRRTTSLVALAVAAVIALPVGMAMAVGSEDPHPSPATDGSKVLIVNARGTGKVDSSSEPGRTKFEIPLYDVATGEKVGRSTHNFICNSAGACDDKDTYYIGDSVLHKEAQVSAPFDGQRAPGGFITTTHPTVGPLDGTGIFAGKTGTVRVMGTADGSQMPNLFTLDEVYVITYK